MEKELPNTSNSIQNVSSFARRSYKVYLEHFRSRNLNPTLTMEEFMANYATK